MTSCAALHPSLANRFINRCGLCCSRVRMGFCFPFAERSRSQAYFTLDLVFSFFLAAPIPWLVVVAPRFMNVNLGCHSKMTSRRQRTPLTGVFFELLNLELRIGLSRQYSNQAVNSRTAAKNLIFTPTCLSLEFSLTSLSPGYKALPS